MHIFTKLVFCCIIMQCFSCSIFVDHYKLVNDAFYPLSEKQVAEIFNSISEYKFEDKVKNIIFHNDYEYPTQSGNATYETGEIELNPQIQFSKIDRLDVLIHEIGHLSGPYKIKNLFNNVYDTRYFIFAFEYEAIKYLENRESNHDEYVDPKIYHAFWLVENYLIFSNAIEESKAMAFSLCFINRMDDSKYKKDLWEQAVLYMLAIKLHNFFSETIYYPIGKTTEFHFHGKFYLFILLDAFNYDLDKTYGCICQSDLIEIIATISNRLKEKSLEQIFDSAEKQLKVRLDYKAMPIHKEYTEIIHSMQNAGMEGVKESVETIMSNDIAINAINSSTCSLADGWETHPHQ